MIQARARLLPALLLALLVSGCTGTPERTPEPRLTESGDCVSGIRLDGHRYRLHNAITQSQPHGRLLGTGDIVGCHWRTATPVDTVKVYAIKGVATDVAVMTDDPDWGAIYVAPGRSVKELGLAIYGLSCEGQMIGTAIDGGDGSPGTRADVASAWASQHLDPGYRVGQIDPQPGHTKIEIVDENGAGQALVSVTRADDGRWRVDQATYCEAVE